MRARLHRLGPDSGRPYDQNPDRNASGVATAGAVAVLALLAYIPALLSSPDRLPADTKLYLYLDPGRLISDAPWTFDNRQFAGWVPHQVIAYLWP